MVYKAAPPRQCLKGAPRRLGLGPDHRQLKPWAELPDEGPGELASILYDVQAQGDWPQQRLLVYIALTSKPGGGGRPTALTASLYKSPAMLTGSQSAGWQTELIEFWGNAAKGSSPPQAALARALQSEVATPPYPAPAGQHWMILGLSKLFDPIEAAKPHTSVETLGLMYCIVS